MRARMKEAGTQTTVYQHGHVRYIVIEVEKTVERPGPYVREVFVYDNTAQKAQQFDEIDNPLAEPPPILPPWRSKREGGEGGEQRLWSRLPPTHRVCAGVGVQRQPVHGTGNEYACHDRYDGLQYDSYNSMMVNR